MDPSRNRSAGPFLYNYPRKVNKVNRNTLLLSLVCLLALPVSAQAEPDYTRAGHYVTLTAGQARNSFDHNADFSNLYRPRDQRYDTTEHLFVGGCFWYRCGAVDFDNDVEVVETSGQFLDWHTVTGHFNDSFLYGGAVGYRFDRNFALELRVDRVKGFRLDNEFDISEVEDENFEETYFFKGSKKLGAFGGTYCEGCDAREAHAQLDRKDLELQGVAGVLAGKFLYPVLNDRLQPFVSAGVGLANFRLSGPSNTAGHETEVLYRAGAGFDFYLTENVVVGTEGAYNAPTGDLREFGFWTIGTNLTYRF